MASDEDEYTVGYGHPPKNTRFRPGQSGNPKGRPKKPPSLKDDLARELNQRTRVEERGRKRLVSKQRAIISAIVRSALTGNVRAATLVINLATKLLADADKQQPEESVPSGDDALIESFLRRNLRRHPTEGEGTLENTNEPEQEDD